MTSVAPLALHGIYGTEVAKVAPLVAHCTLHGTEGMTVSFLMSFWGPEESCDSEPQTLEVEGTTNIN